MQKNGTIVRKNKLLGVALSEAVALRTIAEKARDDESAARAEAQDNLKLAEDQNIVALEALHALASDAQNHLRNRADLQGLRKDLLDIAIAGFDGVVARMPRQANRYDLYEAGTQQRIGDFYRDVGKPTEALERYESARAILARMAAAQPDDFHIRVLQARIFNSLGDLHLNHLGNTRTARDLYEQALEVRLERARRAEAAVGDTDDTLNERDDARQDVANEYSLLARTALKLGELERANRLYLDELAWRDRLSEGRRRTVTANRERSGLLEKLGTVLIKLDRFDDGRDYYEQSLALRQHIAANARNHIYAQSDVFMQQANIGALLLTEENEPEEALRLFEQVLDGWRQLLDANPDDVYLKRARSYGHYFVGAALERLGRIAESDDQFRQCLALRRALVGDPNAKISMIDLAVAEARCGAHREASNRIADVLRVPPTDSNIYFQAACIYAQCAGAARRAATESVADLALLVQGPPDRPEDVVPWLDALLTAFDAARVRRVGVGPCRPGLRRPRSRHRRRLARPLGPPHRPRPRPPPADPRYPPLLDALTPPTRAVALVP